ncbi:MAG: spore maturation protein [Alphaproteobacteria bacterium]|nr:spore maturation protein [Alphaproteobacteria bacterium]
MMLNFIFCLFFLGGFLNAVFLSFTGQTEIFSKIVQALFDAASNGFQISIGLTGMLCLWLGLLKIGEQSGLTNLLAKGLNPLFKRLIPEVPSSHPAIGSMVMNMAANILGLDNAATPMGLKAMNELQELNPHKDKASKAQVLFMVINASAVTLIPINILMYRYQLGSINPTAVFIPILLATSVSTLVGFLSVSAVYKINIFNKVILSYLLGFMAFIAGVAYYFTTLPPDLRLTCSNIFANFIMLLFITVFILSGVIKKLNVYDVFIKGAKEGFDIAVKIIPYLVSMLCAIAVFRASGLMDLCIQGLSWCFECLHLNTDFAPALPTAFMKPLSGSGARAMMIETLTHYGADSFEGFVASVMQGSTETTFYVLAVYFGSVKISKTGAAVPCALLADLAGLTAAVIFSYIFF